MALLPVIPESVTVHLGAPNTNAQNVTVPFKDYIKNVASSEIYPTWPENAIRANIYAQLSFTLNRIYTEFYRSRGYDFDITNSTAFDQSFVNGRDIFDNISRIVDEIFNSYVRREGFIEPLFTAYCDGVEVTCNGLSQWGSVSLAEDGLTPYQILQYYYGDDIDIVNDVPVTGITASLPPIPLRRGSSGPDTQLIQIRLNRISKNFPAIPKIYPQDGVFGPETEEAVKEFQRVFNLTPDGIVGPATWYEIQAIYNAVKRLNEVASEGLTLSEVSTQYPNELSVGSSGVGVLVLQYYLAFISEFVNTVSAPAIDGSFGPATEAAVRSYQRTYGIAETGIVDRITWDSIYNNYLGIIRTLDLDLQSGIPLPFPGEILRIGAEGDSVRLLQEYLSYIADTYTEIPKITPDGVFGSATRDAVAAFMELFDIPGTRGTVNSVVWNAIAEVYSDLYNGNQRSRGQYPGYALSEGGTI